MPTTSMLKKQDGQVAACWGGPKSTRILEKRTCGLMKPRKSVYFRKKYCRIMHAMDDYDCYFLCQLHDSTTLTMRGEFEREKMIWNLTPFKCAFVICFLQWICFCCSFFSEFLVNSTLFSKYGAAIALQQKGWHALKKPLCFSGLAYGLLFTTTLYYCGFIWRSLRVT